MGESYFAFCQAIAENGVGCRAFAVDTWQGDVHTGTYGDEVFNEIDAYNTELYSGFSRLLRMRFDDAVEKFNDESIDLLHIDGEHTYEAVGRDFRRWWPKVKSGGVVIMHDAAERHHDFGVWKLLEELRREFPVAEFVHSHGLGVIIKPPLPQKGNVATALVGADENGLRQMRQYYETCADHLQLQFLRKKQERGAEWEVTSQLFWRGLNTAFTETNSIRLAHIVGAQRSEAFLKLPASPTPYGGFRLALTLLPAFLQLHRVAVTTAGGEQLWMINAGNASELQKGGLHAIVADDRESLLILDPPAGSQFDLTLPDSVQNQLMAGGVFTLEMSGLDPYTFASRLLSAQELRLAEHCSGSKEKQTKVVRVEKSFTSRILRRFNR
jgi:Methyltransferase domain